MQHLLKCNYRICSKWPPISYTQTWRRACHWFIMRNVDSMTCLVIHLARFSRHIIANFTSSLTIPIHGSLPFIRYNFISKFGHYNWNTYYLKLLIIEYSQSSAFAKNINLNLILSWNLRNTINLVSSNNRSLKIDKDLTKLLLKSGDVSFS